MKSVPSGVTVALACLCAFRGIIQGQDSPVRLAFPSGNLFAPLIADPKQPRILGALANVRFPDRGMTVAAAAVGEDVGIFRWSRHDGGGVQLGLAGGIFAQFDLSTPSRDLVNADYVIGLPVTFRRSRFSGRAEIYHQSSHLGDEYVLHQPVPRINLSFESFALLLSGDLGTRWRLYGGGEYLLRRDPGTLARAIERAGLEYRGGGIPFSLGLMGRAHPVLAVDVRSWEDHDWLPALSLHAGFEFRPDTALRDWAGRIWSIVFVLYRGPSPYGQFYSQTIKYAGAALQLGF
jgi:hypothetical protein